MERIYFDNAATTPIDPLVIQEMTKWMELNYGNPSSIHADGRKVRAGIEEVRKQIANYINASIGEIFFTSGGTESNNMALKCAVRDLGVNRIISTKSEHHCVLHCLDHLATRGVEIEFLPIDAQGRISLDDLSNALKKDEAKTLVSLMHGNNEIGSVSPMKAISKICQEHNALYHSDTVQTMAHFPFDVQDQPITFLSGSAHKFHGPKGAGFIYINGNHKVHPLIDGGSQERNMRAGTENVYGIRGMGTALTLAIDEMETRKSKITQLRSMLKEELIKNIPDIQFNGDQENFLYTVLSVSFPPHPKNTMLLLNLDMEGISASGGSACTSGAEKGSHVLQAIGASEERKSIRFSFSHYNTPADVEILVEKLVRILAPVEV